MAKAFFRLRKAVDKKPQIIYVGLKYGLDQLIVSTGIKVLPKHFDFKSSRVKQKVALPEVSLPVPLLEKINGQNISSFVNDYLHNLAEFVNKKSFLTKELLKVEIESYLKGKNEVEQFASDLNALVSGLVASARDEKRHLSKEDLIAEIDNFLRPPQRSVTLFEYIEKFISETKEGKRLIDGKKLYNNGTIKRFKTTLSVLIEFQGNYNRIIDFDTIDLKFYDAYSLFLTQEKDYKPDNAGKHIRTLKTFLNSATEDGVNTNLDFQKKAFKIVSKNNEESTSIALNERELLEMYNLDLSDSPKLEKVRDLFIIGANTGLRFSDFTSIKPENIRKDDDGEFIEIIQYKTKRKVIVPINQTVREILSRYNNELPKAISNQKFNDYIKEIAERCPSLHEIEFLSYVKGGKDIKESIERYRLVSSHVARRSFATNAYERGTPVKAIMAITSHLTEESFKRYIKTSKRKQAEIFRGYQK